MCCWSGFCLLERFKSGLGSRSGCSWSFLIWLRIFEFQILCNIFLQPWAKCESQKTMFIYSNLISRRKYQEYNPFTSSLYICPQFCLQQGRGAGGVNASPLTTLFPSWFLNISFKDDVTVILLPGVFPSCLLFTGSWRGCPTGRNLKRRNSQSSRTGWKTTI